jgi:hypothetical protein
MKRRMARAGLGPWLALLGLALILELPARGVHEPVRPTGEVLLLLTVFLLATRLPRFRSVALWVVALAGGLLWLYRADRLGFRLAFHDEPLLYDQLFMARHLFVLLGDVWSLWLGGGLLAAALLLWGGGWLVRRLARSAAALASPERGRNTLRVLGALWLVALIASALPPAAAAKRRWVRWLTPALISNVQRSIETYHAVDHDVASSPYRAYAQLRLTHKPDIYLVMIESYGRVMVENPMMRAPWAVQVTRMQRTLEAAGWHMASAFSRAPVMGGRSWLAEGSVLMGARVRYEAVFRQLIAQIGRVPNLHGFLHAQGYHRTLLAPADRVRPGVEEANYYDYDRCVRYEDLHYTGPRMGWGIVPDQYSLAYFSEHVLPQLPQPRVIDYHMVTSHAPWRALPELVDDYRTLNRGKGKRFEEHDVDNVHKRLERYLREERFAYMGDLKYDLAARYRDTILYDLAVLERHFSTVSDDAVVIMLGDHQPPFISSETEGFDTPIHVLARDPNVLAELQAQGFTPGLRLQRGASAAVWHQGLFSLLVRALARSSGLPEAQWPAYVRKGVRLGD